MPKGYHDSPHGPPPGGRKRRAVATRAEVMRIIRMAEDREESPMIVALDNMSFWHGEARRFGEQLQSLPKPFLDNLTAAMPALTKMLYARERSQECAVQLMPYFYPRISQITLTGADGGAIRHEVAAADAKAGAEQLKSASDDDLISRYMESVAMDEPVVANDPEPAEGEADDRQQEAG